MKKLLTALSLVLVIAILIPMTAFAAGEPEADISAVVSVDGGVYVLEGAPGVEALGDFDSYAILSGEDEILDVAPTGSPESDPDPDGSGDHDGTAAEAASGGFYSVRFSLPDTTKEVFLTGLTAGKVDEIKSRLIENYTTAGADFDLEDVSFIDTEKTITVEEDDDEEMCWASATANILTYTGWAAQAGFETADDVFEAFIAAFENKGGNPYYGVGWFFNGYSGNDPNAAAMTPGTGGYFTDYVFDQLCDNVDFFGNLIGGFASLRRHLEEGDGITIDLSLYERSSGAYSNGHSVTCWGYVVDTAYASDAAGYNAGLFLTDSDSDWAEDDRRGAPNILHAVSLAARGKGADMYYRFLFPEYIAVVDGMNYLKPYSDTLAKETDPDATRNKNTAPDLRIRGAYFGTDFAAASTKLDKIESNTNFYFTPIVYNDSYAAYSGKLQAYTEVTAADGSVVMTDDSHADSVNISSGRGLSFGKSLTYREGLPAGDYTMTFTANTEKAVQEAYYYNNGYSFDFKVRDSYVFGDVNGDGWVDILDATAIQRLLVNYEINAADGYMERACLDGGEELDIMFATAIQRWLVKYEVGYPFEEKALYNGIYS